ATIVDVMVLGSVYAILSTLVAVVLRHPLPRFSQLGPDYVVDMAVNGGVLAEAGVAMLVILGFLYFFLFTALRGQTFGKHLMRVKVIDAFGERPSIARSLLRTAAYLPSLLLLALGFLWIGFDREKRGLHDWLADTYVVKA
ncbi:MAG: RDD family protein, partial [Polyangia bacterium]